MQDGWIKLWRKIWVDDFFVERRKFSRFEAWIDMLLMANHKDRTHIISGEWVQSQRGSFPTSERFLEKRWRWSREKVRKYLHDLETIEKINKNQTTKGTIIHIINYDIYQGNGTTDQTTEKPLTRPQKNQIQEYKELKNEKKKNIILSDDDFLLEMKRIYYWVDVDKELLKMDAYKLIHPKWNKTRRTITAWLNRHRVDQPIAESPPMDKTDRLIYEMKKEREHEHLKPT